MMEFEVFFHSLFVLTVKEVQKICFQPTQEDNSLILCDVAVFIFYFHLFIYLFIYLFDRYKQMFIKIC